MIKHSRHLWPVPYSCAQPYHPGSGTMDSCFGFAMPHQHGTGRNRTKSFKRQLHTTHVGAVGCEPRTRQFSHGMRWEGGSTLIANRGQQSQNSCAWLCGCIRYWPRRGLVFECVTCFYSLLYNKHLVWVNILWIKLTKSSADVTSKSTISANPACFAIWAFTNWSPKKGEQIIGTPW